jgi:hypothetical protein
MLRSVTKVLRRYEFLEDGPFRAATFKDGSMATMAVMLYKDETIS